MTANTSATGGYVVPISSSPPSDAVLDRIIHDLIAGTTGLDPTLVRPRWQPTVPPTPEPTVDWCAFGVVDIDPGEPSIVHSSSGNGSDSLIRTETLQYIASFYGADGYGNASMFRDCLAIPQNLEAIQAAGLNLGDGSGRIVSAPSLINNQWQRKFDLRFTLTRQITRVFPILNIETFQTAIVTETSSQSNSFPSP